MEYLPNLVAGVATLVLGFLWYGPFTLDKAWRKAAEMSDEKVEGGNMAVIFGLAFVFAVIFSFVLDFICGLHEDPKDINFMHGALHGVMLVGMVALPVLFSNALFERRGIMYFLINGGYWLLVGAVMGGILMVWNP